MKVVIGSRGSNLALRQSEIVKQELIKIVPQLEVEIKVIKTKGDLVLNKPLNQIGDKGIFTAAIEEQLLNEKIDLAVHSLKDMPSVLPEGLMLAGTVNSDDARDCLVFNPQKNYHSLNDLPSGAIVATGSIRRQTQLKKLRPDLKCVGIRGNIETRLEKLVSEDYDAIILASAGLKRLGLSKNIGQYFTYTQMIPACNQGILALEVKKNHPILKLINQIVDDKTTFRMNLERLYQETINGNCHLPIGGHASINNDEVTFYALYGNDDGSYIYRQCFKFTDDYEKNVVAIAKLMKEKVKQHG